MLTMIILSLLTVAITGVSAAVSDSAKNKLRPLANELAKRIEKNDKLKNELIEAYNKKDYDLMNSLLYASPFSSNYKRIMEVRDQMKKDFDYYNDAIDKEQAELNGKLNNANALDNNSNGIIGGSIAHDEISKGALKTSDPSEAINKLTNGGVASFSNAGLTGLGAIQKKTS